MQGLQREDAKPQNKTIKNVILRKRNTKDAKPRKRDIKSVHRTGVNSAATHRLFGGVGFQTWCQHESSHCKSHPYQI
ncbi:hypothetical protein BaRGS_00009725 [Batillaria attramentaria]|uniref:Uncharacterized protein n=1 Tax=Batillaria attramentaria TaxID=370345 RepID=A0ABD0LID4_9CAEN